jgi:hypothetical protein
MNTLKTLAVAAALVATVMPAKAADPAFVWPKNSQFTCIGLLEQSRGAYRLSPNPEDKMKTWCDADLSEGKEVQVLKACSLNDQCIIKGVIEGHGTFAWVKIYSVRKR